MQPASHGGSIMPVISLVFNCSSSSSTVTTPVVHSNKHHNISDLSFKFTTKLPQAGQEHVYNHSSSQAVLLKFVTCNVLHYLANCSKLEPGFYKLIDISASTVKGLWLVGFHSQQTHLESCIRAIYLCSCKSGICVFFLRKLSLFTRSICTVYVGDVPANTEFLFKFVLQPCWPAC